MITFTKYQTFKRFLKLTAIVMLSLCLTKLSNENNRDKIDENLLCRISLISEQYMPPIQQKHFINLMLKTNKL